MRTEGNICEVDIQPLEHSHEDLDEEELSNLPVTYVDDETFNTDTPHFQLSSTSQVIPQDAETDKFSEQSSSAKPSNRPMNRSTTFSDSVPATSSRKRRNEQGDHV